MGNRVRTAAPGGDWRTLTALCEDSDGHDQYDLVFVHDTVAMVYFEESVDEGDTFYPIYHCEKIVVNKRTGTAYAATAGDKVFWSGINGDPVYPFYRSGMYWIGIFTEAAAADDDTAEIDLKGDKATVLDPV